MLVVMSNLGYWDNDLMGAVGLIESPNQFIPFVQSHTEMDSEICIDINATFIDEPSAIKEALYEQEVGCISEGTITQLVVIGDMVYATVSFEE